MKIRHGSLRADEGSTTRDGFIKSLLFKMSKGSFFSHNRG